MTIWHGMIKVVEVKKFNKDMAVADKDNRDNNKQSINSITNSGNNNSNNNNGIKLHSRHSGISLPMNLCQKSELQQIFGHTHSRTFQFLAARPFAFF